MKHPSLTILITGAGSGLGRGLACSLARAGHSIIVTDLSLESARETADQVREGGGQAEAYGLDVTSEKEIAQLWQEFDGRSIDGLISNAGLQHVAPVEDFETAHWDKLIAVMLTGSFLMTRAVLPGMRKNGFGRVILIGSIHSLIASPYKSAYVAAKHALVGFAKAVALETAEVEITCNTICPAYVRTPLVDAQISAQARTRNLSEADVIQHVMLEPMPKKAFITVEEIAAAAEYLLSPLARNITGQTITIDGGWTAR